MSGPRTVSRDLVYGLVAMVVIAPLQVLVVTKDFVAVGLVLAIGTVIAVLCLIAARRWPGPVEDVDTGSAPSNWTGTRLIVTLFVFAAAGLAGTLRGLDAPAWAWLPLATISLCIVVLGSILARRR